MHDAEKTHGLYLGLGSNLGNKEININHAIENINERIGTVAAISAFFINAPVGFESENMFVNAVVKVHTELNALEVLEATKLIEKDMGRATKSVNKKYTDRIIDIDLLLFDHQIIEYPEILTLPHPHLHERAFVLVPLSEIAGEYIHPVLGKSIKELKDEFIQKNESAV